MAMKTQQGVNSFLNSVYEKEEYRVRVSSVASKPDEHNNPSLGIGYSAEGNVNRIVKDFDGVSYEKLITYSAEGDVTNVSEWQKI